MAESSHSKFAANGLWERSMKVQLQRRGRRVQIDTNEMLYSGDVELCSVQQSSRQTGPLK